MNLKELILFGMEESQEPVIKNPILQAALREPRPMAHGGRPGFQSGQLVDHGPGRLELFAGGTVIKENGAKLVKLYNEGHSANAIATKLKYNRKSVLAAIKAINNPEINTGTLKFKPDIIKLKVNKSEKNLKNPKVIERVQAIADANPTLNKTDLMNKNLITEAESRIKGIEFGFEGKHWSDEGRKRANKQYSDWIKKKSSSYIEDLTSGDKKIQKHHAGALSEKVRTGNLIAMNASMNRHIYHAFEKKIDAIQYKQRANNLNRNISIEEKAKVFKNLEAEEAALRAKYPEYTKYKSTMVYEPSAMSKTGYMHKEKMLDPSMTFSKGEAGQDIALKKASKKETKEIVKMSKKSLELKKGDPLHTELMKFCPSGKQLAKAGGGRIGFAGTCSIDEAATGLKNELSKVKNPAQLGKLGKFGKIGRLAGGFFGWVDAPIELTFALPGLLKGDKDEALSNTTLGLFGAGKTEMEKLKPGTALYNVAKNIKDVQDYTNNLFQAKELEAYTTKLEGMLKKYPNDSTIEDDLAQTNLQKQKIIDDTQTIIKDYREVTGDERIQARKELSAQEIASAKEGFTITDVPFVGDVKFAPYGKPKDLSNVKDYIENKGDPYYRATRVADENLGGIMGYDENAKDIRDRYTDLPLELASQYGTFEKQEADELARQKKEKYLLKHSPMPFSEYVPSILRGAPKFMGFNAGGRVSFSGGGMGRRAFLKLLAALGIGTAGAKAGLLGLSKVAGKKAAVQVGVDIATSTPGMPSWFPALVNKIIKEGDDVTAKLATQERQIVHTKKIDTGSASPDDVTIYRDLDTGDIRVEVDSVSNMGEAPIQLDYKAPSVIDSGKMAGQKTKPEFSAVETEPRVVNWDGDIEFDGENIVGSVDDLFSDTTKLKNYAKGEKPTMKDFVTRKKKTDKVQKLHNDTMEQIDYIENKHGGGPGSIEDDLTETARISGAKSSEANPDTLLQNFPDKYFWKDKKASGGRVSYFDGGIVSLKKKW